MAPDITDGWQWSKTELSETTTRADSGDSKAANRLFQYYSIHENEGKRAYWQDWLLKRGDPGAIKLEAHSLFSSSKQRRNGDPRKLMELREAERLWISVHSKAGANPFLEKIRSEIRSIENAQMQ